MRVAGLIGHPIAHSRSPAMQNAAFAALSVAARYELWPTATSVGLAQRIARLRRPDVLGANVTIPHKVAVMDLLNDLMPSAQEVGAVNTIIPRAKRLEGHNTDAAGLVAALREAGYGACARGAILGAGGAARAAIVALRRMGATHVHLIARAPQAAAELARIVGGAISWSTLAETSVPAALPAADIVVNATPVGSVDQPGMPMPEEWLDKLSPHALVVDLIAAPTAWARAAQAHGMAVMTGLPMLLHQGALALELWLGRPAPLDVMRAALGLAVVGIGERASQPQDDTAEMEDGG